MKLLLDTHSFLWMSTDESKLSETAREMIADLEHELLLSPASYWEIAIKVKLGKYTMDESIDAFVGREVERNALQIFPIEPRHAAEVARLPFHHRDPFDRMLVAQAAGKPAKEIKQLQKKQQELEDFLSEMQDFEDKLRRAANLHLEPDLNDGVVLNIAPLWELVPWKEAKKYWDELLEGKYEWSSIGKQLREKGLVK